MNSEDRINNLHKMLKEEPNDSFLNYALAIEYHKQGNAIQAIEMVENVIQFNPDYLGAYLQLGQWYESIDKAEKAIVTYQDGCIIAQKQLNHKALSELNQAIFMLED